MIKTYTAKTESDLDFISKDILFISSEISNIYALYGKMGSGKTSLIKAFCRQLQCKEPATSPTFAIVNEYLSAESQKVFHFDFYRIESIDEAYDLGYEEYFYDAGTPVFIEWPEMIEPLLPPEHIKIIISETDNKHRKIDIIHIC